MLKRAPLVWSEAAGWHVDLPTCSMVRASLLPVVDGLTSPDGVLLAAKRAEVEVLGCTVLVQLPVNFPLRSDGQADARALRRMYGAHPRFGSVEWSPPELREP